MADHDIEQAGDYPSAGWYDPDETPASDRQVLQSLGVGPRHDTVGCEECQELLEAEVVKIRAALAAAERDRDTLAAVGRMYLDALDNDPDNELLTLPEAMLVTEVREAVDRAALAGGSGEAGA